MQEKWLKCRVGPGMFSDESAVTVNSVAALATELRSLFVAEEYVRPDRLSDEGHVRVRVFQRGTTWWAVLPNEEQEAIPVRSADLEPA